MINMRPIYFLSFLLSLFAMQVNAQIKSTIMDVTLGQTKYQTVLNMVQNKGYEISQTPETISCLDVEFAGYGWKKTVFHFYKNTLYKVKFEDPYVISEKNIESWKRPTKPSEIMKSLREAVKSKYSRYGSYSTFDDGVTKLSIILTDMTYENIALSKKASAEALNDL